VVGVADEDHVVGPQSHRVEHGTELLRPFETVGEHHDLGRPSDSRKLSSAADRMLVRADGPSVESSHQCFDALEGQRARVVVAPEVVVDRDPEPRALVGERVAERDLVGRDAERNERRDERRVGIKEGSVEVEDRYDRRRGRGQESRGVMTDDRLDRPRNSPLVASSSQRAPHVRQAQESRRREAR
jgi:hypothetical protein